MTLPFNSLKVKNEQGRYGLNGIPKVNEKRNADKKFCRENKKIAEQERLLGYYYISQKFLSVDVWFGLCENSHNAKAKNKEYKNIVNFF